MNTPRTLHPTATDTVAIRSVIGAAFADDPMMQWVFRGVTMPEQAIAAWVGLFVDAFAGGGVVDVVPDEDDPHALLSAWDESGERLAQARVAPNFKLSAESARRWAEGGFRAP